MLANKTDDRVLRALSGLMQDARFRIVLEYLEQELKTSDLRLRQLEDPYKIGKNQGMSLTLASFLEKARTASDFINQRESN